MTASAGTGLVTAFVVAGALALVIALGIYIWYALALSRLFPRIGGEGWKGWVPVLNEAEILARGGVPAWSVVFYFIPIVQLYGLYLKVVATHRINKRFGRGAGTTVLAILLPPVWATVLAWGAPPYPTDDRLAALQQGSGRMPQPPVAPAGDASGYTTPPLAPAAPAPSQSQFAPASPPLPGSVPARPQPSPAVVDEPIIVSAPWSAPAPASASAPVPVYTPAPAAAPPPASVRPAPSAFAPASVPPIAPAPIAQPASVPFVAPPASAPPASVPPVVADAGLPDLLDKTVVSARPIDDDDEFDATVVVARRPGIQRVLVLDDGRRFVLSGASVVIGRNPEGAPREQRLAISDDTRTLSKTHARLVVNGDEWRLTDLHSTNGVVVVAEDGTETLLDAGESVVGKGRFVLGDVGMHVIAESAT